MTITAQHAEATLNDTSRRSPFWYSGGWFLPGTAAMVLATTVAVLMVNTTLYTGPISAALGGADLSSLAGPALAAGLYALLWRTTRPYRDAATRPAQSWMTPDPGASTHHSNQDESIAATGEAVRSGR